MWLVKPCRKSLKGTAMLSWKFKIFKILFYLQHFLSHRFYKKSASKGDAAILRYYREKAEKNIQPKNSHYKTINNTSFKGLYIENKKCKSNKVILYFHGGGYVFGSAKSELAIAHYLSKYSGANIYSLDYRLAPEHPFPHAIDDALNAYLFLFDQGYSAKNIVVAGLSAGGGLAVATLLKLRDSGVQLLPSCAICFSPWFDLKYRTELFKHSKYEKDFLINSIDYEFRKKWPTMYLSEISPLNPLASPYHGDLKGLPPMFIQMSKEEILYTGTMRFVDKAALANVSIQLDVWDDMPHGWQALAAFLPEAQYAIQNAGEYIKNIMN
jgi:monoterpene epsilon-lactone hydrolase